MARGQKGTGKTEYLTDTMAVKLTPDQKKQAVRASMKLGGEIGEAVGNQGIMLAALQIANDLVANGEIDKLVEAYTKAMAEQEAFIAEKVAEKPAEAESLIEE